MIVETTKVVVEAGSKGCFSSEVIRVELKGSDRENVDLYITTEGNCDHLEILPSRALEFIRAILEAATKPEVLAGGRSTTRYEASVEWRDLGSKSGNLRFRSNDEGPALAELISESHWKERAEQLGESFPGSLHCTPFEIYELCVAFQQELAHAR